MSRVRIRLFYMVFFVVLLSKERRYEDYIMGYISNTKMGNTDLLNTIYDCVDSNDINVDTYKILSKIFVNLQNDNSKVVFENMYFLYKNLELPKSTENMLSIIYFWNKSDYHERKRIYSFLHDDMYRIAITNSDLDDVLNDMSRHLSIKSSRNNVVFDINHDPVNYIVFDRKQIIKENNVFRMALKDTTMKIAAFCTGGLLAYLWSRNSKD